MIRGAQYWSDRTRYFIQTNNALEAVLKQYAAEEYLVACGPTAAVMCIAAMGGMVDCEAPGEWIPQPEDVLTLWFHDRRNWDELYRIRPETAPGSTHYSPHEVPQYYPAAVRSVFDARASFRWTGDFYAIANHVSNRETAMIALRNPGHFISVVAYDDQAEELIYHDPWPDRLDDKQGFSRRMGLVEYNENVQPYAVVFTEVA